MLRSMLSIRPALFMRLPNSRLLSQEARSKIQQAVSGSPVVLFMKGSPAAPECGYSRAVVQILGLQQVPSEKVVTYNVLADPELRNGIKEFSDWPTIPQLYVNGEFVGGADILLSMHQSGELETLFENANIIPKIEGEQVPVHVAS
ncbi:Glutaredoxin [Mycena indigotica]|uniref:Monothiol glutaredoxin-5, mitochondrial n=1 Tax=Mycena indigotica TaxID=2126181 RepID=A0A8H6WBR5_9AGAR|nr:Glutaredoxin [Mycena indigotica]KAF7312092.1 Glutaredoxin [Mycena indigotica]